MKAFLRVLLLVLFCVSVAHAQTTTVSGSATDSNGQLYANGTYSITFNPNGQTPPFFLAGSPFSPTVFSGFLNGSGAFSGINVPSNTSITPVGTKWTIQFCPQASSPCFVTNVIITGGSQAVNVTTPPIVVNAGVNQLAQAYSDSEISGAVVGSVYFNTGIINPGIRVCTLSPTPCIWSSSGGGGGGGGSFATLSSGTNTQANMVVGTGAVLSANGTGQINATTAPFSGLTGGTSVANLVIGSGGFLNFSGTGIINASTLNSTTVPFNSAGDQVLLTLAPLVGSWGSIPLCLDSAGQHLNYNTSTHAFSCGTSGGSAGSAAFNSITTGVNTQATMTVGTGAVITASGSGQINATSMPFGGLTSGTNTTAALVVGTGASINPSGSGVVNANQLNATTAPTNAAADQYFGTSAPAVGFWASMPSCLDAGGNHINYNTSTHTFTCGTTGGTAGSVAFNAITGGTNGSAAMIIGTGASLTTSGSGSISATTMLFSGLTTATNTTATLTMGTGAVMTTSGSGQINANFLSGTSIPVNAAADQVVLTTSALVGAWTSIPNCLDTVGQHLNYNTSTHLFACGTTSSGGGGAGNPASPSGSIQVNNLGTFASVSLNGIVFGFDSGSSPTTFSNPFFFKQSGNSCFSGLSPWIDITCPPYGARGVQINTTATGSGSSITVGSASFQNNDPITIAAVGNAPTMTNPTGLTVTPMVSAGFSTQDTPSVTGLAGASNYTYTIFPIDILGGANVPLTPVSISTGNATIGSFPPFALATESLLNNVLTLVTTSASGLPQNAMIHVTATSNNHYFGGWYPISNISGSTITVNNVAQYCNPACTGTGGQIVAFVGNVLKWTPATTSNSFNSTWAYGICAQRPGDGALHLVAITYPQSLNTVGNANTVSIFNDYGTHFNTPIPWDLSDANCTSVSAQPQRYVGKVVSGGGTTSLGVTPAIPIPPSGQLARYDTAPIINAAMTAAGNEGTTFIPPQPGSGLFPINSVLNVPFKASVIQQGDLLANAPIYSSTVTWWGLNSGIGGGAFSQGLGPIINCINANPCFYTGAAMQGNSGVQNITFQADHNSVIALIDSAWGEKWTGNTFQFFNSGNSDYSGVCMMIRPQGSEYIIRDIDCLTGPGIGLDTSWAPGMYANGLCGGTNTCPNTGSVGTITVNNYTQSIRSFLIENNGGSGTNVKIDMGYSQGATQPNFSMQNINGNVNSSIEIDHFNHDTESQAVFAGICGLGCASAFNGAAGISPKIGHVSALGADAGSYPWQVTGGGNARNLIDLAVFANSGNEAGIPGVFVLGRGLYLSQFRNYMYGGVLTNDPQLGVSDFFPNVPTPALCLENSGFCSTYQPATLTANRTVIAPNASGVNCVTGLADCLTMVDSGVANAYAGCPTVALTVVPPSFFFVIQMAHSNTGPSTINLCSLGAIPIKKNGGTAGSVGVDLAANDIKVGMFFCGEFDGTNIQAMCQLGNGGSGGGNVTITGSPALGNLMCMATSPNITNCSIGGDVTFSTTAGVTTDTVNSIQGIPVSTSGVAVGQSFQVLPGPVYQNVYPGINYNPQTGSYTITCPGDRFGDVDFTGSAPNPAIITLPLIVAGTCTGFNAGAVVHNGGTVPVNLQATTSTIDGNSGATGVWIPPGAARFVYSDTLVTPAYHTVLVSAGFGGINVQTVSYTATAGDNGKRIIMNCAAACVLTLPATPPTTGETTAGTRWTTTVQSNGATLATVSLNGKTFNGGASAPILLQFQDQDFETDGSNYFGSAPFVASTNITLTPSSNGVAISAAGGGAGPTIQTNGVSNSTQSTLNFQTSTAAAAAGRITPRNPSGGNEQFDITNLVGTDAGVATAGATSSTAGQPACSTANGGFTSTTANCVPGFTTLTDGATVTWATASVPNANSTLTFTAHGGSRTLNLTGLVTGGTYVVKLIQDATGGENLIGGTGCTWKQLGNGGTTFTLTSAPNAVDIVSFMYDGTNCLANLGKNYN